MNAAPEQHKHETTWRAELKLRFARNASRTVLASREHIGPLVVQRPFYPEGDACHVYLVHPPGGVAGGDMLSLKAELDVGAHAVITTPAATKFYRTLPDRQALLDQVLTCTDATSEWLPQENIFFCDTRARTATVIRLTRHSRCIAWELNCYGRPASNELFDRGQLRQRLELWVDGAPTLLDHLRLDGRGDTMQAGWGLASHTVFGTLLAYPADATDLEEARAHESFACTLSCRFVGHDCDMAKQAFMRLWQTLRPRMIGREALPPRIWAT